MSVTFQPSTVPPFIEGLERLSLPSRRIAHLEKFFEQALSSQESAELSYLYIGALCQLRPIGTDRLAQAVEKLAQLPSSPLIDCYKELGGICRDYAQQTGPTSPLMTRLQAIEDRLGGRGINTRFQQELSSLKDRIKQESAYPLINGIRKFIDDRIKFHALSRSITSITLIVTAHLPKGGLRFELAEQNLDGIDLSSLSYHIVDDEVILKIRSFVNAISLSGATSPVYIKFTYAIAAGRTPYYGVIFNTLTAGS